MQSTMSALEIGELLASISQTLDDYHAGHTTGPFGNDMGAWLSGLKWNHPDEPCAATLVVWGGRLNARDYPVVEKLRQLCVTIHQRG